MVTEFHDKSDPDAHDKFQTWRRINKEAGFFINVKSKNDLRLHRAYCGHFEDTERGKEEWGSLTKSEKICSTDKDELRTWSKENYSAPLKVCSTCRT